MFRKLRRALRETDEDRARLSRRYAALAGECERRAYWAEFVLEAPDMGVLRRCWRRCKLLLYRRAERTARGDMERLRG